MYRQRTSDRVVTFDRISKPVGFGLSTRDGSHASESLVGIAIRLSLLQIALVVDQYSVDG